ncbi:alpha-protein kinase 3 [Archocentrus centrarchus]|uniref:alpha-protein kinase 3 n=1 Tax=Archocentrus centrarchus TaxID=63155 RepID=UPI0011EA0505|nr:alpha-protein kinase 3-like [Archocentrus centrarchus]
MTSRRTTARSSNGNGRSSNGEDVNGSSRLGGCSYLSNVRPENRSTLCSVIAHLTEETQPSFEITLKSKAVSENSNVKFSCVVTGYPAPQVTWYKDDMQLDRYCGLPKYEIFRNGQNHSLHIYKCTVEDAAIYQASAINCKGIVSCSGVLEVGEMNEFKIHQRYFAKVKQKAENRRREAEGKENQEPIRTISPDRTLRKRRSTMEAFLSTPSSMEDEGNEENQTTVTLETKARLQEATGEEAEEKQVPITNGEMPGLSKGQAINDNGNKGETCINDSTQKIFTTHQPKPPFVKKKIKISNNAKVGKADALGERVSVSGQRRLKGEASASVAPACKEAVRTQRNSAEVMEVENISSSSVAHSAVTNVIKEDLKSAVQVAVLPQRPSQDEKMCTELTVISQKEQLTVSVSPAALTFSSHPGSRTEGENAAKYEKEAGNNAIEESLKMQEQIPYITSTQPQSSARSTLLSILKEDFHTTTMDVDLKSNASADGSLSHKHSESVDASCDSRTALSQRPCEQAGHQLSEKETSPSQNKVPVSQVPLPSEVTQDPTKMIWNDAPVSLELPADQCMVSSRQQKTPVERPTMTDDIQTPFLHSGFKTDVDTMTQDTWDHSRELNEVLFKNVQKSPLERSIGGESTLGCNISLNILQSQVDPTIKTIEETEIQDDKKVEVTKLLVQDDSDGPNEKIVEMETETAAVHTTEQTKIEKSKDTGIKDARGIIVGAPYEETEQNEGVSKVVEKSSSDSQNLKADTYDTSPSILTKTTENANSVGYIKGFQEISKPETKIISIAELLRSQIKALDSTVVSPVSVIPSHANLLHNQSTATGACQELVHDRNLEVKKSMPDRENKKGIDETPPTTIKATLMEVYHQLYKTDQERSKTQSATSPPVQVLQKPLLIPPIAIIDSGTNDVITGLPRSDEKYNECVMDIGQETQPSTLAHPKNSSVVVSQQTTPKQNFPSLTSEGEMTDRLLNLSGTASQESGPPLTTTDMKNGVQEPQIAILERSKDEPVQGKGMQFMQKSTPEIKLSSTNERDLTTISDQCKMEDQYINTSSLQSTGTLPPETGSNTPGNNRPLTQKESYMVKEGLTSDSVANQTAELSPLLKKRNCVSPIPSATPQELASGARRKILTPKAKPEEATETTEATSPTDNQTLKKEASMQSSKLSTTSVTFSTSPSLLRQSSLLQPTGEQTSLLERRSPLLSRKKMAPETPSQVAADEIQTEVKPVEKDKHNPFKAPQVIRKIRAETFADASGHLKLWCQFFNVLSDSTIQWSKNEVEIAQVKRKAGDEAQVNLAILQASCKDSGVYGCSITNEYGTDSTDTLLSAEILTGLSLREDLGVGEEIEMTPLIFSKGVADSGVWGNKFFGRIMMKESRIGDGCSHKVWRAKVIYGLEPVFESGNTCIIKVRNPIAYGGKEESCLIDRNLDIMKQECKIQNMAREYCKIFAAETRVIENFGPSLEVIPVYLMYRPANAVPYATVETDLTGVYQKFSDLNSTHGIDVRTGSEMEQKCCALQHWIFQWTSGNLVFTRLEGVDTKITNVEISVKSTGHQGLSIEANPKVFEQFISQHKCNYFCGLLGLRSLKVMDSLLTPTKPKSSRSPLLQRKMAAGSSSPQTGRKAAGSPRLSRKTEQEGSKTPTKQKAGDAPKAI